MILPATPMLPDVEHFFTDLDDTDDMPLPSGVADTVARIDVEDFINEVLDFVEVIDPPDDMEMN